MGGGNTIPAKTKFNKRQRNKTPQKKSAGSGNSSAASSDNDFEFLPFSDSDSSGSPSPVSDPSRTDFQDKNPTDTQHGATTMLNPNTNADTSQSASATTSNTTAGAAAVQPSDVIQITEQQLTALEQQVALYIFLDKPLAPKASQYSWSAMTGTAKGFQGLDDDFKFNAAIYTKFEQALSQTISTDTGSCATFIEALKSIEFSKTGHRFPKIMGELRQAFITASTSPDKDLLGTLVRASQALRKSHAAEPEGSAKKKKDPIASFVAYGTTTPLMDFVRDTARNKQKYPAATNKPSDAPNNLDAQHSIAQVELYLHLDALNKQGRDTDGEGTTVKLRDIIHQMHEIFAHFKELRRFAGNANEAADFVNVINREQAALENYTSPDNASKLMGILKTVGNQSQELRQSITNQVTVFNKAFALAFLDEVDAYTRNSTARSMLTGSQGALNDVAPLQKKM